MAFSTRLREICRVHVGAWIGGGPDIMNAVTTRTVGRSQLAGTQGEAMKAVLESRHLVRRQPESFAQTRVPVTAPACFAGNIRRKDR